MRQLPKARLWLVAAILIIPIIVWAGGVTYHTGLVTTTSGVIIKGGDFDFQTSGATSRFKLTKTTGACVWTPQMATGNAISIAPSTTTGYGIHLGPPIITTGTAFRITLPTGATGNFLNCIRDTSSVFSVNYLGNATIAGTCDVTGATNLGTLTTSGATRTPILSTVVASAIAGYSAPNATITTTEYGKTIFAAAEFGCTLPTTAPAAGTYLRVIQTADANLVVTTAAGTGIMIADGSTAVKTCTWSTGGHKIGACAFIISNGSKWIVVNQSRECAMTIGT